MVRAEDLLYAASFPVPENPVLELDGCRRLMGPNLFGQETGAVGDALCRGVDPAPILARWRDEARRILSALGKDAEILRTRLWDGGCTIFVSAEADQMIAATFVIEAAWHLTACRHIGQSGMAFETIVADIAGIAKAEANPALVALVAEAAERGIDRLLEDDHLTLGHGAGSQTWDTAALPAAPHWAALHDIPVALVTGTNGKTTTTRLLAAMGTAAGKVSGLSSTDFVRVGDEIIDRGDYSGPMGARLLLRDPRLEVGVLEVARGGILRRGLPVTRARVAVVTNAAADHLGQYGINTVAELATAKLTVRRALAEDGVLVVNAGDAPVMDEVRALGLAPVCFALDPANPAIAEARAAGRACGWLQDGQIMLSDGKETVALIDVADVPLTLGGAAGYNIENALGAALAARVLGLPDTAIRKALASFRSDPKDNPGRANEFAVRGARVFVDFAHNPHSIAAVTGALGALEARHRYVLLAHAGDRSDDDIRGLTSGAFALRPDYVVAAENPKYLRGREMGVVPGLIRDEAMAQGLPADHVLMAPSVAEGAAMIVKRLGPGDLALLLVHDERAKIFAMLEAESAKI